MGLDPSWNRLVYEPILSEKFMNTVIFSARWCGGLGRKTPGYLIWSLEVEVGFDFEERRDLTAMGQLRSQLAKGEEG